VSIKLQTEIFRTHDAVQRGERGAKARLEELQRQYREGRYLIERYPVDATATLIEPGSSSSPRRRRVKQQAQVERDSSMPPTASRPRGRRPHWQLGNDGYESWRLR
jgi:hypothetical protein